MARDQPTVRGKAKWLTKQWAEAFPALSVWKSKRLARRVGPIVQAVELESSHFDPQAYWPVVHVDVLLNRFVTEDGPSVFGGVLSDRIQTPGGELRLDVRWHDQEFSDAVETVRQGAVLPLDAVPTLRDTLNAYRNALEVDRHIHEYSALEDMVLLPALMGDTEKVEEGLDLAREVSSSWKKNWWREPVFEGVDNAGPGWLEGLAARAENREELQRLVDEKVAYHKLDKVNYCEMPLK